jgi:3-oxoacyl-[acyl-carrier-protein] synthase II
MNVAGVGVVFTRGRGIETLENALAQGWIPPAIKTVPSSPDQTMPVYSVEQETISDKAILKNMRRADRFGKMAVLAASDAVRDSGIVVQNRSGDVGLILATAFGPQVTAFRFLDEIIDYGDSNVSPILFTHSVHNAAASYIASALNNHGPTLTVTQFDLSFHQALIVAQAWIHEGRCKAVLVGAVEESGTVMEYICSQKLKIAGDGKIRPFAFSSSPSAVPGEGSAFLVLTAEDKPGRHCEIAGVFVDSAGAQEYPDLCLLDADGMSTDETSYQDIVNKGVPVAAYSPLFGSIMTGSAFHCASAALMLRNQTRYACPVQDNPHGVTLCNETEPRRLETIQCIKYSCFREKAVIELRR